MVVEVVTGDFSIFIAVAAAENDILRSAIFLSAAASLSCLTVTAGGDFGLNGGLASVLEEGVAAVAAVTAVTVDVYREEEGDRGGG